MNAQAANKENVFTKIKNLNSVSALVVDYFSKRERQARTTYLMRLAHELETEYSQPIDWNELVATFRDGYMKVKAGSLVTGKTPEKHRFEWGLSLVDVAKAALGQLSPDEIKPAPTGKTRIVYPVGYHPKKKNKDAVRAKRKGVRGRLNGGKNSVKRSPPVLNLSTPEEPAPRVFAAPAPVGMGVEVQVIEGGKIRRYEVSSEKLQAFETVLPAFAVAK